MEKLAMLGGPQACPPGTLPAWPMHSADEENALLRTLRSGIWWRVPGAEVDRFEADFAKLHEVRHALGVTNGTQALEIGLACLGVGMGDEVLVPAFTFASTITAVLYAGATPVPVDVDLDTYCMSQKAAAEAITERTKAIIPVHLAGHACDMDGICALARAHVLRVLADAAHAQGARHRSGPIARLCDAAIFSFQSGKLLTAGEGGALLTDDPELARKAWLKHSCGRPRDDVSYGHTLLGTNARMTEFQGAILGAQLRRFPEQLAEREKAALRLDAAMMRMSGLEPQRRSDWVETHSHYMYMVRNVSSETGLSRDELVDALVAEGVPAFRSYRCVVDLEMFSGGSLWAGDPPAGLRASAVRSALDRNPVTNARKLGKESLWLHHRVLLGGERVQAAVADAFAKVLANADSIRQRAPRQAENRAG